MRATGAKRAMALDSGRLFGDDKGA
ncbi:hypothetical protein ELI_10865 [Erythrobacter litoralis HTCC2594]|uniref:Uncharacterized protein n=1 Tax=Erythrobacter litoralis (strain HTCC2594) TaxID=314225 RepID=Q2N7S6_ERYLH|nr:hypothetical protein ELI_10865 [Erythrobacter litoralis HTCC2594]